MWVVGRPRAGVRRGCARVGASAGGRVSTGVAPAAATLPSGEVSSRFDRTSHTPMPTRATAAGNGSSHQASSTRTATATIAPTDDQGMGHLAQVHVLRTGPRGWSGGRSGSATHATR